ncbi:hypothetical protein LO772_16880 [Yinghuangia sp. ASG 101]|uniref:hypothetical protein n=1 Tax=Yinghuangia sp. ASG 101 TaxID=2896848 RepID=UPI001E439089|nr:hypothetical protein [Yinghuangia sp. ASG 101]UGQ15088.1 hypothetical protein LO772_16880 [Yinghuangia sp. ASG 101]
MTGKRIAAASAALALGGALLSGTASAAPAAGAPGHHCVINADNAATTCFATVAEVQGFITQSRAGDGALAARATAAGSYTAAVLWDYYGSPESNWITSDYQCTYYGTGNIPWAFNDKTSYVDVSAGCYLKLWQHTNQAGIVEGFPPGGWNVTQINNQASSWEIYP